MYNKMFDFNELKTVKEKANDCESTLITKNIKIFGKRSSIRLEPEMWDAFDDIAERENCSDNDICSLVYFLKKPGTSMTAAIRVFIMLYYRASSTIEGHEKAGHGDFQNMLRRARISAHDFDNLKALETRVNITSVFAKSEHNMSARTAVN